MWLIDSNIFIYAAGKEHPNKQPCLHLLQRTLEHPGNYTVNVELLQEILHVYSNRKLVEKGVSLVQEIITLFPHALPIFIQDIQKATSLLAQYAFLEARDALHAATVLNNNLEGMISFDQHLTRLREIRVALPQDFID